MVESFCLLKIFAGFSSLPSVKIGMPPYEVGMGIPRVYLYGLVAVRDGLVILAFFTIGSSSIDIGMGILRVYLYGLVII